MIRSLDRWLIPYLLRSRRRPHRTPDQPLHVFIAVCDHFEPFHGTSKTGALKALDDWAQAWPRMVDSQSDSSGRGPRHTFFYPIEQYDPDILARLADICRRTQSEVEIHLHHADDTADSLTNLLEQGIKNLTSHGLLSQSSGRPPRYGFIHGNWALDNSHSQRKHCGVDDELTVLRATGCYADFTLPSAPDSSQTPILNSVYYARENGKPNSHSTGTPVCNSITQSLSENPQHLLLVQGPLGLNWRRRKLGLLPRLENADLTQANPPTLERFQLWVKLAPFVQNGPPWIFVKLHTHGGIPTNYSTLLGSPGLEFHQSLAQYTRQNPAIRYHYVTAREMVNLIHAAESATTLNPHEALNFRHPPPPLFHSPSR